GRQKGQPFVVVLGLVLPLQECRQLREDHALGLATEHMADPLVAAVRLKRLPVVRQAGRRERFPCFRHLSAPVLGPDQEEARGGAGRPGCVTPYHGDGLVEPPLTVFRQALSEQEPGVSPGVYRWVGGRGTPGEGDRLAQLIPRGGPEQTGPAGSLREVRIG